MVFPFSSSRPSAIFLLRTNLYTNSYVGAAYTSAQTLQPSTSYRTHATPILQFCARDNDEQSNIRKKICIGYPCWELRLYSSFSLACLQAGAPRIKYDYRYVEDSRNLDIIRNHCFWSLNKLINKSHSLPNSSTQFAV